MFFVEMSRFVKAMEMLALLDQAVWNHNLVVTSRRKCQMVAFGRVAVICGKHHPVPQVLPVTYSDRLYIHGSVDSLREHATGA